MINFKSMAELLDHYHPLPMPEVLEALESLIQCSHDERSIVSRTYRDGSKHFVSQCSRCGDVSISPIAKHKVRPPIDPYNADLKEEWLLFCKNIRRFKKDLYYATTEDFYASTAWKELRVGVIEEYGAQCAMCGRSPKEHGIVIHVDHIKPRSKHPELSLDFNNLQILCEDCNLGKMANYETDWRS